MNKFYTYIILLILIIFFFIKNYKSIEGFEDTKKNILIVGGTSGIGNNLLKIFPVEKYNIMIVGRKKIPTPNVITISSDLSKKDSVDRIYNYIEKNYGYLDLLINNFYDSNKIDDMNYQINTNLINNININKKFYNIMKPSSMIINVSTGISNSVDSIDDSIDSYVLIKNAIEKYTKILASKIYYRKIAVTCLRINNSYKTDLTKNFGINLKSGNSDEINKCFSYIISKNWNEVTGRIFISSDILDKNESKDLDIDYTLNNTGIDFLKKNKSLVGLNIFEMSENIKKVIHNNIWNFEKYMNEKGNLRELIGKKYNIKSQILFHNGTMDFLNNILPVFVKKNHNIITPKTSWFAIKEISEKHNIVLNLSNTFVKDKYEYIDFNDIYYKINSNTRLIYLVGPIVKNYFDDFYKKINSNIIIVIDMCYYDFFSNLRNLSNFSDLVSKDNIIIVNTFSKFYSLPGLNLSYSITNHKLNNILKNIYNYPVNNFKEQIAFTAMNDTSRNNHVISHYSKERERLGILLEKSKLEYYFTFQNCLNIKTNIKENEIKKKLNTKNIDIMFVLEDNIFLFPLEKPKTNDIIIDLLINN